MTEPAPCWLDAGHPVQAGPRARRCATWTPGTRSMAGAGQRALPRTRDTPFRRRHRARAALPDTPPGIPRRRCATGTSGTPGRHHPQGSGALPEPRTPLQAPLPSRHCAAWTRVPAPGTTFEPAPRHLDAWHPLQGTAPSRRGQGQACAYLIALITPPAVNSGSSGRSGSSRAARQAPVARAATRRDV